MRILGLLLLSVCAFGATCTSSLAAGTYNLSATTTGQWSCSKIPGNGDQMLLPNGVTMHLDYDATIGDSAAVTTAAIDCTTASGTCQVIFDAGHTFTINADIYSRNNRMIICATPSQSGCAGLNAPTVIVGNVNAHLYSYGVSNTSNGLTIGCLACPHITWSGLPVFSGGTKSGSTSIFGLDATNMGTTGACATSPAAGCSIALYGSTSSNAQHVIRDIKFVNGGAILLVGLAAAEGFDVEGIQWTGSMLGTYANANSLHIYNLNSPSGNPTRYIADISHYGLGRITHAGGNGPCGITIRRVYSSTNSTTGTGGFGGQSGFNCNDTDTDYIFVHAVGREAQVPSGTVKHPLGLSNWPSGNGNWDFIRQGVPLALGTGYNDGPLVQPWHGTGVEAGDPFDFTDNGGGASPYTGNYTVRGALLLRGVNGGSFKSISAGTSVMADNKSHVVEYNTIVVCNAATAQGNISLEAVGTVGNAGVVPADFDTFRSNYTYGYGGTCPTITHWPQFLITTATSYSTLTNPTLLAGYNFSSGTFYNGTTTFPYHNSNTSWPAAGQAGDVNSSIPGFCHGTCGAHDQTGVNANFADPSRDFNSWCKMVDPANTDWNSCVPKIMDVYSGTHDARYCVWGGPMCAYEWIRAGYEVTNGVMRRAGHDGGDIGGPYTTNKSHAGASDTNTRPYIF